MKPVRLGAVDYLNARPLVFGLELHPEFVLRFDPPSKCAALLHEGSIDVGMIPSIEYLRGGPYCAVPRVAIVSEGPVASVALFSTKPLEAVRSIAADTSSRTSNALLRVLCYETLGIEAELVPMPPRPLEMLRRHDAALLIGDAALFFDDEAAGVAKIDLGDRWTAMTGLPFVWAFWAGRAGALTSGHVRSLVEATDSGIVEADKIAAIYCGPERAQRGQQYLRENVRYGWGERESAGLRKYYELALKHGIVGGIRAPAFYRF
ncbi:MAG: menaquinone biosynthetic enzyme MqnA/MqnD family protein [Vicinamibacterales bacterium]